MTTTGLFWLNQLFSVDRAGLRRRLAEHHPALNELPRRIAILGAADEGRRLGEICRRHGVAIAAIVDDSPKRQGTIVADQRVESAGGLDAVDRDIPVIIASHRTLDASRMLKSKGFRHVSPFAALQILHGQVFPPHMFHAGWFEDLLDHRDDYVRLAERLGDDLSRRTLDSVLAYRQTLDPETLAEVTTPWADLYLPAGLFTLGEHETYVDGGAYDGDTIRLFIERTGGRFEKVLGFEPDPATFARLGANFAEEPRVIPINAGLWSRADTLRFQNDAGRASILGEDGDVLVKVVALDEVLSGETCSFIKMNIEGAELDALKGAALTIRRFAPKLAISAYHRPSDLWEVAKVVDEIAPGYDLRLRQQCGGVVETVLYALPRRRDAA